MSLQGQKILIVGGTSGIGFATAQLVAAQGGTPIITGRDAARLEKAVAALPAGARGEVMDFTQDASVDAALTRLIAIDHLVLTASSSAAWGPFGQIDTSQLATAFQNKAWGYWRVTQAAVKHLSATGSITMVSGAAARLAAPGMAGLAAVNGAINGFAQVLAVELAPRRVNVVSPGLVATEAYDGMPADQRAGFFAATAQKLPAGRIGAPDDIASVILLTITNPFLTGALIDIDGGARLAP
jgi:NAD(P)-dependent dehydrogenase (short-subunit alcohol dehydrogenase family)